MADAGPVSSGISATPRSLPTWLTAGAHDISEPKVRSVSASPANDHQLRSIGSKAPILMESEEARRVSAGCGVRSKGLSSPIGLLWCRRDDGAAMVNNPITMVRIRPAARSCLGGAPDPHGGNRALAPPLAELDARPFDQAEQLAPPDAVALHHRLDHRILQHLVDARLVRRRVR